MLEYSPFQALENIFSIMLNSIMLNFMIKA